MALTIQDVINRAMRLVGILAAGEDPTGTESTDALYVYNSLVQSLFGDIIGPKLVAQSLPTAMGNAAATYGIYPGILYQGTGGGNKTLQIQQQPKDGMRFGVADTNGAFNVAPVKLDPGAFGIVLAPDGASAGGVQTLNTAGYSATWFFRADTGVFVNEADQTLTDTPYFPAAVIEALVTLLAVRLGAEYGNAAQVKPEVEQMAQQGRDIIAKRYARQSRSIIAPGRNQAPQPNVYRSGT